MSKKMWNKIFKTKTKINNKTLVVNENKQKRCSILYQEYQQLNAVLPKKTEQNSNNTDNNEQLLQVQFNFNKHSPLKNSNRKEKEQINTVNDIVDDTKHSNGELSNASIQKTEIENSQQLSPKENTKTKNKNRPQFSRFAKVVNSFSLKRSKNLQTTKKFENDTKDTSSKIESTKENIADTIAVDEPSTNVVLSPCPICNRTFNPVTLSKHVGICQKTATKRRKVFDSSRQRREGTDLAAYPVPKNYGLPPQPNIFPKTERSISPQQHNEVATPATTRKRTVSQSTPANDDLVRSTVRTSMRSKPTHSSKVSNTNESNFQRERMRSSERINAKRAQVPQSEQCPHCDRCFGIKAYDRHVEWCKEKALQAAIKQPNAKHEQNPAMERLQARTKYKAPCLKTKRSINRDKYSGMNSEENDSFESNKTNAIKNDLTANNALMTQSMTSSITSESGKYDPFLLAKRQLEELCSPTTPPTSLATSQIVHSNSNSTPTTPLPQNKSMTTSLNFATSTPNARQVANKGTSTLQSNFRRTSSLRGQRRSPLLSSRPLFVTNYRPTIQRGLSDEGPISNNFLKPEEYDEMPVRSVCVNDFALTKSPRVVRRDLNATLNRKPNLKLNLQNNNNSSNTNNSNKSINLLEEKEVSNKPEIKEGCKTDSLAVFLKYERELEQLASQQEKEVKERKEETKSNVDNPMISKDLKNKSNNALTKQNSLKNMLEKTYDNLPLILPKTEQLSQSNKSQLVNERNKLPQLPLMKTKVTAINLNTIFGDDAYKMVASSENIDPKLINKCDNLPLNLTSLQQQQQQQQKPQQQMHKISTPPSPPPRKQQQQQQQNINTTTPINVGNGNRLKRKMRLGLNHFLYDTSPDDTTDSTESEHKSQEKTPDLPVFDDLDFDFEEFISSFEQDNEQFPLFKDCKEFLSNRNANKQRSAITTNSTQLPLIKPLTFETFSPQPKTVDCEQKEARKREIFISIEAEQSDFGQSPLSPASLRNIVGNAQTVVDVHEVGASNEAKFSKISDDDVDADESVILDSEESSLPNVQLNNAKNLIQRIQNQFQQFDGQQHQQQQKQQRQDTPVHFASGDADEDSDDLSNTNMLSMTRNSRRSISTKISADSAYGSLCRQRSSELSTPQSRTMNQTRPSTANLPMPTVVVLQQQQQTQSIQQQFYKTKHNKARSNQYVYKGSSSGSGSDTSLPVIDFQNNFNQLQQQQQAVGRLRRNNSRILESSQKNNDTKNNNNNNNNNSNNSQNNVNESQIPEVLMMSSASNLNLESPMTSSSSSNPSMSSSACKRMSKFCHECGSKFIVEQAKFCMDCGVKRIIL